MLNSRSQLDQTLVEATSLPEGELDLSRLNKLLKDSDLVLVLLDLEILVDSCQALLALPCQYPFDLLKSFGKIAVSRLS